VKVLVTGHGGFIGRHITAACRSRGWDVAGCDLRFGDDCRDLFAEDDTRYDLVFHCAAIVGGRAKIDGDPLAIATNMSLDVEAFRWALRTGVGRFVYWSSSAVYPVSLQHPGALPLLDGSPAPCDPDQTYGWAKLTGERIADEARRRGLTVDIYRPFSGYGEDQDLDYPFPSFIARAKGGVRPFEIWGDGTQVRDWIHVDDIVATVFAGLDNTGQVDRLNLCTGRATSFNELAHLCMEAASGRSWPIHRLTDAPTGVHTRVGDPQRMLQLHTPQVSLEEGIARCFR